MRLQSCGQRLIDLTKFESSKNSAAADGRRRLCSVQDQVNEMREL